jgi:DNA-directed RNA polymerase subunit RPC12/RpoP
MTTAPPAFKALPQVRTPQDKFALERTTFGGITLLTLQGTLDQAFEGRKIAESVHTKKLVVSMRNVRRFASWGMSEWMDFLRINATRELYLVECSTYAMSQINLVTGLLGHAKLVSFYASYRCGSCSEEHETLFIIPRDRETIRDLPGSQHECPTCGGRARLEEYPAAFFEMIADRPSFDIEDEILAFFRSHLQYALAPDLTRFRAFRRVHKGYTYIRMSGSLTTLPRDLMVAASEGTTVADLEGIVFDPAHSHVTEWRTYLRTVLPKLKSLQLLHCPLGFLEHAVAPEDLRDKLKVRTFALPYDCLRCETTTAHMVDVAENLEQLVVGTAPSLRCTTCGSSLVAIPSPDQIAFMRCLPARDRDAALDRFLAAVRGEPSAKLENCLVTLPPQGMPKAPVGARRLMYVALGLAMLILGGLVAVALGLWKQRGEPTSVAGNQGAVIARPPPTFERPAWIVSDIPSSAYCHDMINRLMCIGVSSYRPTRDEAVAEASDAALEELVSAVGLKISDPVFREAVISGYAGARAKALSALQGAELDQASAAYTAADDVVTKARKRVVEILRASGGAAVPTQRSDWYWEEYAAKKGGTEVLVFVRYDVTLDAVRALVEKYSAATPIIGSTAMTAFPALAWQYADFTGGVWLTKVGHPLADAGIAPQSMVMRVGEQRVGDAIGFARRIEEWKQATGDLALTVKTGDTPARVVEVRRPRTQ